MTTTSVGSPSLVRSAAHRSAPPASRLAGGSAFAIQQAARDVETAGGDVVHLELGEPDWAPPQAVLDAVSSAFEDDGRRYTHAAGEASVRAEVADRYSALSGTGLTAEQVVLVPGSNMVLHFTLLAAVGHGDEVLIPDPGFPPYAELVRLAGAVPVRYRLRASEGFRPDISELRSLTSGRTRLVVVNSPNNPTGGTIPGPVLRQIAEIAVEGGSHVLFDEAYREFGDVAGSYTAYEILEDYPRTIVLETLSKSHAMCGWRAGFAVTSRELAASFSLLMTNTNCCMPSMVQRVIPAALRSGDEVAVRARRLAHRREFVRGELQSMPGVEVTPHSSGLYLFPDITATGLSDREFADRLLREAHVAAVPGSLYGPHGTGHIRIACTQEMPALAEGMRRLRTFLGDLEQLRAAE